MFPHTCTPTSGYIHGHKRTHPHLKHEPSFRRKAKIHIAHRCCVLVILWGSNALTRHYRKNNNMHYQFTLPLFSSLILRNQITIFLFPVITTSTVCVHVVAFCSTMTRYSKATLFTLLQSENKRSFFKKCIFKKCSAGVCTIKYFNES